MLKIVFYKIIHVQSICIESSYTDVPSTVKSPTKFCAIVSIDN